MKTFWVANICFLEQTVIKPAELQILDEKPLALLFSS